MVISVIGMTIVLLSLLYFHIELSREYLNIHLENQNKNLAIVLRNSLLAQGLEKILIEKKPRLSDREMQQISATLQRELLWVPVVKVKVYSTDRMVLYSTKPEEIGQSAKNNKGVIAALDGQAVSNLVYRNHINEFDQHIESLSLHQQYIPIKNHSTGEILGAFEIYTDVSKILSHLEQKQRNIFWSISLILLIFYLALSFSFLGTHRLLRRETRKRQAHLDELLQIRNELEQRVTKRTLELDKSRQFLQSVIDGIGNPLLVIRRDFSIALMNQAAREQIPEGADPSSYTHCYQISHRRDEPCDGADHPCTFATVLATGHMTRMRHRHHDKEGNLKLVDLVSTPLYSADGEIIGLIEVEHDITQMVQMQAVLEQSEARLKAIMSNVPDAILTLDADFVIETVNPAAQALLGADESRLVGKRFTRFIAADGEDFIRQAVRAGQSEVLLKRLDGTKCPVEIWLGPLGRQDPITQYIVVCRDISKRLQAEQELETARQQYFHQEKMAAIGELAAGILHEVGNPIAAIAGAAHELQAITANAKGASGECLLDDPVSSNIAMIEEQAQRLARITREIADFASPKPRQRELLDLNNLLQSTARLLAYDRRFKYVELELKLDKTLPAIFGVADQLTQVFMNLLINAMDASAAQQDNPKKIEISSQLDGDRVHIQVRDHGSGMPPETLSHAFEPYFSTKPMGKGSGLGLSLCDTIVKSHGGQMTIDSVENQGTTVHVFLPVSLPDDRQ